MRKTLSGLLAVLLVLSVGAGTVTATGRSGTDLNVCTNEAKDYYGGIKVYAKDEGKGGDRVLCVPTKESLTCEPPRCGEPSLTFRRGIKSDGDLNRRNPRRPPLEDIWNGFGKDIESFELRAAAGCRTVVMLAVSRQLEPEVSAVVSLLFRTLDNVEGATPETRLYEIPGRKDDKATALELSVICPPELPPGPDTTIDAGEAAGSLSPSPSPTALGQRVEVPEVGVAVTFPEGWTVETREVVERTDSPEATTVEARTTQVYGTAPDGSASCLLIEDRLEGSLDESVTYQRSRYEPVLVEMSSIELPLGRAIRFVLDYSDREAVGAVYLLSDGAALFVLSCTAPEPPDDDWWLSVAESFEFLPAEEE